MTDTLSYDALNHLVESSASNGGQEYYVYDASGNRVLKRSTSAGTTTLTAYPFGLQELYYTSSGTLSSQLDYYTLAGHLVGLVNSAGTIVYQLTDAEGTVLLTIGSSAVLGEQAYGPYGNQRYGVGTIGTDKGYTGQFHDSVTGFDYYVARYYDPVIGQFLSPDTVQGNAAGMDPYAYVGGNPETRTDPTGQRYTCGPSDSGCSGGGGGGNSGGGESGGGGGNGCDGFGYNKYGEPCNPNPPIKPPHRGGSGSGDGTGGCHGGSRDGASASICTTTNPPCSTLQCRASKDKSLIEHNQRWVGLMDLLGQLTSLGSFVVSNLWSIFMLFAGGVDAISRVIAIFQLIASAVPILANIVVDVAKIVSGNAPAWGAAFLDGARAVAAIAGWGAMILSSFWFGASLFSSVARAASGLFKPFVSWVTSLITGVTSQTNYALNHRDYVLQYGSAEDIISECSYEGLGDC